MKPLLALLLFGISFANAQTARIKGVVISEFGSTYEVPKLDIPLDTTQTFKVLFDLSAAPEDPEQLSGYINTVARFINMHVGAGKPENQLQVAAVFHGNASYSLLKNDLYKEKFGVDNPNLELIQALQAADVDIILCGQTAGHRNLTEDRRIPGVQMALSTMTAMIQLQQDGYTIINFN
ncbi:DsrE family protein [Gilvibacter sediminis]|uniref:DsrE family protein n=1 Tax=Gilvibacter sediminis TaxID=379071 RepID=UPI002350A312|nr:DsrE family protein [Gilvibacter sediminis]MDC7997912.1 DsrE family protein [Gilvibacter sediminis]